MQKGNCQADVPPVPTWTFLDCGFVHRPADLLRLDANRLQIKACLEPFDAVSDVIERAQHVTFVTEPLLRLSPIVLQTHS